MSSQDVPARDPVEKLTLPNLSKSFHSEVCPLCGSVKEPDSAICPNCWRKTPMRLHALLRKPDLDRGYADVMRQLLRDHQKTKFILPDDPTQLPQISHRPLRIEELTPPLLLRSVNSQVCPKCVGAKKPGCAFCHTCMGILTATLAAHSGKRGSSAAVHAREVQKLMESIEPARLVIDAAGYAKGIYRALKYMQARSFYFPTNPPQEVT